VCGRFKTDRRAVWVFLQSEGLSFKKIDLAGFGQASAERLKEAVCRLSPLQNAWLIPYFIDYMTKKWSIR
jgi:hypothetical protein